mgnify:FL=1
MDQDQVEVTLKKIFPLILPKQVEDVFFDVNHTAPDEFTLYAAFVVDDEWRDDMDPLSKEAFLLDLKRSLRRKIKGYTNINVVFDSVNTRVVKKRQEIYRNEVRNN